MEVKKPAVQNVWPLRLRKIDNDNLPHVAKFSEVVDWQSAVKPMMLYEAQEELKEEDSLSVVKDREYFKRKQKNKRYYRKKNMLILEDSSVVVKGAKSNKLSSKADLSGGVTSARMRFEGHKVNMELADNETERHGESESSSGSRYVLLQFIKREMPAETDGRAATGINEISVIPVRDMYSFKKASYVPDETLDEIDEKYIEERQRTKENLLRYKGISNALINAEKNRLLREGGGGGGGDEQDVQIGFDATSLFGSAVNKIFSAGKSNVAKTTPGVRGSSSSYALSTDPTYAVEEGMYNDEEKEFDWCAGDYSARCADDEEDNVVFEQANLDELEAVEMSTAIRHDAEGEDNADDDVEDDEEEAADGGGGGDDADGEDGVGLVDKSMVDSATELRKINEVLPGLRGGINQPITSCNGGGGGGGSSNSAVAGGESRAYNVKSALKRPRDESDFNPTVPVDGDAVTSNASNRVTFGTAETLTSTTTSSGEIKSFVSKASLHSSSAKADSGCIDYPLTETGIRLFIAHRNGKATIKELEFFKHQIKEYSSSVGKKSAGREKFLNILEKLTVTVEDPLLGKVLMLKS